MKLLGIIGDPIDHSLSPQMQNAAFRKMRLPYLYLPFHVAPEELGLFFKRARLWKIAGFNITLPHKEKVLGSLDKISAEAKAIGAVNTVVFRRGKFVGYNTDGDGYLHSLWEEKKFSPRGKTIMILGAGGAARALLYTLLRISPKTIYLCNRTPSKAGRLARNFRRKFKEVPLHLLPLKEKILRETFPDLDLLINATSVGLQGTCFKGLPLSSLPKRAIVSDLVYRPMMTPLLLEAKRKGKRIHTGLGMLLHQGAESFRLWTGKRPDIRVMRKALLDALK